MASPKTDSVELWLDPTPLINALIERNMLREVRNETLKRWRRQGIDVYWADKWAVKIGLHPIELFGMEFYRDGQPKKSHLSRV
jgi:hypothetical protein